MKSLDVLDQAVSTVTGLKSVVPTVVVVPVNVCHWPEDSLVTELGIPGMLCSSLRTTPPTNSKWRAGITRPRLEGGETE